jgi:DNA-binding response OmpR family regulator
MSNTPSVMIVEDETEIREILALYLEQASYRVTCAADGATALELLEREAPDLLLLDVMLPDIDGYSICMKIRERSELPIIFISALRDASDIVEGLELGADDYIVKPFEPKVVVAKVNAYFRRKVTKSKYLWKDEWLEIEDDSLDVRIEGEVVQLYAKERQLLVYMAKCPKQVFSVSQLYEEIWGWDRSSDERTVMVHISNLRKKIEEDPSQPKYIVTVKGFGYRFGGSD